MKTKSQRKLAFLKAQRTATLTESDLRGLAAAELSAKKLKFKYENESRDRVEAQPVHFDAMAGPVGER